MKPIHWIDKIPIISFFNLQGRCRNCSSVISWQYPVIEMLTGIIFGLLYIRAISGIGFSLFEQSSEWLIIFIRDVLIACLLLVIFVYDYKYSVIMDRFSVTAIIIAFVANIYLGEDIMWMLLSGLMIGAFFAFQFLISKGKWIGSGDIRMGILIGVLLGLKLGILALLLSYIIGAISGIILIAFKHRSAQSHVPFGTFIAISIIFTLFFGNQIADWYIGLI
jgi:prepilin signal peptidase PulO-like enzyme (type II secretory pathway)